MEPTDNTLEHVVVSLTAEEQKDNFPKRSLRLDRKKNTVSVGRASKVHAKGFVSGLQNGWFDSPVMSRAHAEFVADLDSKTVRVRDLGSLHGTYVNEETDRLPEDKPRYVQDGDRVRFGVPITRNGESFKATCVSLGIEFNNGAQSVGRSTFAVPDNSDVEDDEDIPDITDPDREKEGKDAPAAEPQPDDDGPLEAPVNITLYTPAHAADQTDHLQLQTCTGAASSEKSVADAESDADCNYDLDSIQLSPEEDSGASDDDDNYDLEVDYSSSEGGLDPDDPDSVFWDDDPAEPSVEEETKSTEPQDDAGGPSAAADDVPPLVPSKDDASSRVAPPNPYDIRAIINPVDVGDISLPPLSSPNMPPNLEVSHGSFSDAVRDSARIFRRPESPPMFSPAPPAANQGSATRGGDKAYHHFQSRFSLPLPFDQEFLNGSHLADPFRGVKGDDRFADCLADAISAFDFQNKKKAAQAGREGETSHGRREHLGIADIVENCPVEPSQKGKGKRKADEISGLSDAEKWWEGAMPPAEKSSAAAPEPSLIPVAAETAAAPTSSAEPSGSSAPGTRQNPVDLVKASRKDKSDAERPAKRMRLRHVAEKLGYATLGGATVGAAILTTLIYTAPTLS